MSFTSSLRPRKTCAEAQDDIHRISGFTMWDVHSSENSVMKLVYGALKSFISFKEVFPNLTSAPT